MTEAEKWDQLARGLFGAAKREDREGELLQCLFDGGSATIDAKTGKLVMANRDQLAQMWVKLVTP